MKTKQPTQTGIIIEKQDTAQNIPMFKIKDMEIERQEIIQPDQAKLSFLDIKELYDRAYMAIAEGREDYKAKEMMAEAIKLDMAYRCQLARRANYKQQSKMSDFRIIADVH